MRKLLFIAIALFAWLGAVAQGSKQLININQSSFRAEQKGMIEDVNIDPIAKDRSKRPCARIKLHVNRMTRDDIDRLQVFTAGGMVELTKRVINFEGNGLILEMTAKPQTRFYLHHDKYGDSNEVTVDLEGDKVYLMDAQLDLLLPVVVASNVKGADVYIDNQYKGVIGESYMLSVEGVTPGEHKIKIQHGAATAEQTVNVNNGNISFRVEVNDESSQPQYVVFELQPTHAMLFIDNEPQATQEGFVTAVLQNGTYNYRVIAKGYHEQSGTFTVSGERVVRKVTLKADVAMVTLTTDPSAEIWINNQKQGTGSWSGQLTSGTYIFEARKEGHRTTRLSQVITSAQATQSYKLATPTPIEGSLNITSVPALASVKVDGKVMGDAPLATKLLVGRHTIEVSKSGYDTWRKEVTIAEGQTATVAATLTKASVPAVGTTTTKCQPTQGPYKVGDYYNENGKEGVVFWVDASGFNGKIVSLTESKTDLPWTSDKIEQRRLIGADDKENGANNMAKVRQIPDWQNKYPVFKWCTDLGEGWYLPAIEELKLFTLDKTVRNAINQTLATKGGTKITDIGTWEYYWSSTESNHKYEGMFCAWGVLMSLDFTGSSNKGSLYYVRAVSAFGNKSQPATTQSTTTAAPAVVSGSTYGLYKVGDYYDDGKKQGVVFWVDASGKHGKIVSLTESKTELQWASNKKELKKLIGTDDKENGVNNTARVRWIPNWQSKYPAFKWCTDLGEGWYLPAIEELKLFTLDETVRNTINQTLTTKGGTKIRTSHCYWSSTEQPDDILGFGEFCAWTVNMYDGDTYIYNKLFNYYVRAVSAF